MVSKKGNLKVCIMGAGGRGSDASLFYVAWTTAKNESISFLRKQLRILHTYLISAGTRKIVQHFHDNPSYDLVNDENLCFKVPALKEYCRFLWQDITSVCNLYLPMRLHPITRQAVNSIISKHKPKLREPDEQAEEKDRDDALDMYYYGLLMMNHSIVTIFKNHKDIAVTPCDVNIMFNYTKTNLKNRPSENPKEGD